MSSKIKNEKFCVFCGTTATTRDHIPSKNLFEKTAGINFLTVPSCAECNNGFSLDEDFLRNFLATITFDLSSESTNLFRSKISRAIVRKPKLAQNMFDQMFFIDLVDSNGKKLGKRTAIKITETDHMRIFNVLDKYIKGLFFLNFDQVLPVNYKIKHFWANDKIFKEQKSLVYDLRWYTFDPKIFVYGFGNVQDTFRSVFVTVFFDKISFLSFVNPKNDNIIA